MKELHFGELILEGQGLIEYKVSPSSFLVWRDAVHFEAVFCESVKDIPYLWLTSKNNPWKVFGQFDFIKELFSDFSFPAGTKIIDLEPGALIQINSDQSRVRFMGKRTKRVLVVDDSSTIRKLLTHLISQFPDWKVEVINSAEEIPQSLKNFHPDLVTLDLNLGGINGAEAMKRYLAPLRVPTLLITSQPKQDSGLVMDALTSGALDYIQKPESGKWEIMKDELHHKMEAALRSKWQHHLPTCDSALTTITNSNLSDHLVVIGSSTGGTQALQSIFLRLPANIPPILVTQHIPAGFSKALAERLNGMCPFEIKEAEHGDEVRPGRVLIAPGDHHMRLSQNGRIVEVIKSEPVNRFRPSIEVMFKSVVPLKKIQVTAIMLTGMGKDGAEAMLELRIKGAYTIAQDEASCVVFGMPKEAIRIGAAEVVKSLDEIPECLTKYLSLPTTQQKRVL